MGRNGALVLCGLCMLALALVDATPMPEPVSARVRAIRTRRAPSSAQTFQLAEVDADASIAASASLSAGSRTRGPHDGLTAAAQAAERAQNVQRHKLRAHNPVSWSALTPADQQQLRTLSFGGHSPGAREWRWWKGQEVGSLTRSDGAAISETEATARLIGIQFEDPRAWSGLDELATAGHARAALPLPTDLSGARRSEYCAIESPDGSEVVLLKGGASTCGQKVNGYTDAAGSAVAFVYKRTRSVMHNHPQLSGESLSAQLNAAYLWAENYNNWKQTYPGGTTSTWLTYQLALTPSYQDMKAAWVYAAVLDAVADRAARELVADPTRATAAGEQALTAAQLATLRAPNTHHAATLWSAIISPIELRTDSVPWRAGVSQKKTVSGWRLSRPSHIGPAAAPKITGTDVAVTRYSECRPTTPVAVAANTNPELECRLELWQYSIAWTAADGTPIAYSDANKIVRMRNTGISATVRRKRDGSGVTGLPKNWHFSNQQG